jgi:hypothetical protein
MAMSSSENIIHVRANVRPENVIFKKLKVQCENENKNKCNPEILWTSYLYSKTICRPLKYRKTIPLMTNKIALLKALP